ncbi:alpha-L-fucosidase [Opitutaceae bacterium EW11]|nr:alpha-L-fucosidase [Opitutaceae bacterium EW11]
MNPSKSLLRSLCVSVAAFALPAAHAIPSTAKPAVIVSTAAEPVAPGKFSPTWESLQQYEVPEWFRDAKFGIWAHWGPQCQPERGDWYARQMYSQGAPQYEEHLKLYGHPSKVGFKDVIHSWKAEHWDADKLLALYQRAGARYFFALANHHDNFDNWDSKYQPWNSVNLGPKKDLIGGWAAAARKYGMKFGVSVHAAHAWSWYETAQGADKTGPLAGVPYDGKLTKADGKGTWWDGYDPQDLYEQRHTPSPNFGDLTSLYGRWHWDNGVSQPDQAYCERFYNRTIDLIDKYHPDLIYFDDTALPLWPVTDAGLKIAAHFYNRGLQWRGDDGVLFGKILEPDQRRCMALDIERGRSNVIEPLPWQTDTCLGNWHYDKGVLDNHGYKSARTVIQTLIDVVSKNGNLLLNVPLKGDGTPDADEIAILEGIAAWMQINQEAIHGTRPWKLLGEGPQLAATEATSGSNFNEDKTKPFTAEDIRFTSKGDVLYAFVMGVPKSAIHVKSLGTAAKLLARPIASIRLLGSDEKPVWSQTADALTIEAPKSVPNEIAAVFEITPQK